MGTKVGEGIREDARRISVDDEEVSRRHFVERVVRGRAACQRVNLSERVRRSSDFFYLSFFFKSHLDHI
jgi:hypothetical protein